MELLGRQQELADVEERLSVRRLVTITGPGGIGKTRLAREAIERTSDRSGWVDLTRIDDGHDIAAVVAEQLGYRDLDAVIHDPDDSPFVVAVDNCEHVLEPASAVVARLLDRAAIRLLATSRSPLDLPDESLVPLAPLDLPDVGATGASVELLLARARDRGIDDTGLDLATAAEICRALDGVPLAIEIAAARLGVRSAAEVLRELRERQERLARPRFRGQPTHRSVAEMVNWSVDLLPDAAVRTFEELGVVPGPFTSDMVSAIARSDESLDHLDRLVSASMVVVDTSADVTHFRMLHPVRAVAVDRLRRRADHDEIMSRHVDHVLDRVLRLFAEATGGWDSTIVRRANELYVHVMAALRWALDHDDEPDRSRAFVAVLWGIIHQAHVDEIVEVGEAALEKWPEPGGAWYADACSTVATGRNLLGDPHGAIGLATRTLDRTGESVFAPCTLRRCLGQAYRVIDEPERSIEWFRAGAAAARDAELIGFALEIEADVGRVAAQLGDVDGGARQIRDSIAESERIGAGINVAWGLVALASLELERDPAEAADIARRGVELSLAIEYPAGISFGLHAQAAAELALGDESAAARTLSTLLGQLFGRGGMTDLRMVLGLTAEVLRRRGDEAWADLAVTAAAYPITSVGMDLHLEIADLARGRGEVLDVPTAYRVCRDALERVHDDTAVEADGATSPDPETPPGPVTARSLLRQGDVWEVTFDGRSVVVKSSKGLEDLAALIAVPNRDVSALDLMGAVVEGSAGLEPLDDQARAAYEDRVRELQAEIDEADAANDLHRAERLRVEMDALVDQLTAALGLGGRSRRSGSEAERARSAVTQRVRSTVKRLADLHPALGRHLRATVATGTFCSYRPVDDVAWIVQT